MNAKTLLLGLVATTTFTGGDAFGFRWKSFQHGRSTQQLHSSAIGGGFSGFGGAFGSGGGSTGAGGGFTGTGGGSTGTGAPATEEDNATAPEPASEEDGSGSVTNHFLFHQTGSNSCGAVAHSKSSSDSKNAFVSLGVDIGGYICNTEAITSKAIELVVNDIAYAVADSSVYVSAACDNGGAASAVGAAQSTAEAHAEAMLEGLLTLETCGECKAAAEIFAQTSKEVFVASISDAWVQVEGETDQVVAQEEFERNLVEQIIPTVAAASIQANAGFTGEGEMCSIGFGGGVQTGDNIAICDTYVDSWTKTESINAISEAGAYAGAYTCDQGSVQVAAVANATARAYAQAISISNSACVASSDTPDDTIACVHSETSIRTVVQAQAEAYAGAWAEAMNDCGCDESTDAVSHAIATIILDVASNAFSAACAAGEDAYSQANGFADLVLELTVSAVSVALAETVAGWDECYAGTSADACVGAAAPGRICAGGRGGVMGCQEPLKYQCIEQLNGIATCQPFDRIIPTSWSGKIRSCSENGNSGDR